jgi:hypothetical protein
VDALFKELASKIEFAIIDSIQNSWELANTKNNKFLEYVFSGRNIPTEKLTQYNYRNLDALGAFQKENGMG